VVVLLKDKYSITLHCDGVYKKKGSQYIFSLKSNLNLGSNVKLCFTTFTNFEPQNDNLCTISYKKIGSFVEVLSAVKLGKTWSFTIPNITTALKNITTSPCGIFLVLEDKTHIDIDCTYSSDYKDNNNKIKQIDKYNHVQNHIKVFPQPNYVKIYKNTSSFENGFNIKNNKFAKQADKLLNKTLDTTLAINNNGIKIETKLNKQIKGYKLIIKNNTIKITSKNNTFEFYAFLTLFQLWNFYDKVIPNMIIKDYPKYKYRGMLIDVVRQFYTIDELKELLNHFAIFKINKLHLHLSDDEGWRLKSKKYPQLNKIASFRGYKLKLKPQLGSGYEKSGGYYTKSDIKELINYANKLHIKIIPEFDFPGHSYALIKSLPNLLEKKDKSIYNSVQNYNNNTLNPALNSTWVFLENILNEITKMFSYKYIHLGFDERADGTWINSPACKKMMLDKNIKNTDELQIYFANKLVKIVKKLGKRPIFWEEASKGKLDKYSSLIAWQNKDIIFKMANKGYKVIASPAQYCYFDIREKAKFNSPGACWIDSLSLDKTYSFTLPKHKNIKGIQGALWGETLYDKNKVYKMLFPRVVALAEISWSKDNRKNFSQFEKNLNKEIIKKIKKEVK
jgi:hexosaminidase